VGDDGGERDHGAPATGRGRGRGRRERGRDVGAVGTGGGGGRGGGRSAGSAGRGRGGPHDGASPGGVPRSPSAHARRAHGSAAPLTRARRRRQESPQAHLAEPVPVDWNAIRTEPGQVARLT